MGEIWFLAQDLKISDFSHKSEIVDLESDSFVSLDLFAIWNIAVVLRGKKNEENPFYLLSFEGLKLLSNF